MLTLAEKILFALAVLGSLYAAWQSFGKMFRIIRRGQQPLDLAALPRQLTTGVLALLNQGGLIRHRRTSSIFHYMIAWGFIFYLLVNLVDVLQGYIAGFHLPGPIGNLYHLLADLFSVAALGGMVYFLLRRFLLKDPALTFRDNVKLHPAARRGIPRDSLLVGAFILAHVGFRFIGASFLVAQAGGDSWQPFANLLARLWSGLPPAALSLGWHLCWWLALGVILLFLPYFPYTKHAHLLIGPFNFMTRPRRLSPAAQAPIDFDNESLEQFGVARLTDLSQTQLVDPFACIMCNRCQEVCPAYVTGKELSPAALEINKRYHIWQNFAPLAAGEEDTSSLLDFALSESALWACTSCGACVEVCPVGNEPMLDILDIRRHQVLMESDFPVQLKAAFNGIERNANPWQMTQERLAWAKSLDFAVPTVVENPDYEVLYWVGCAGAFDPTAQEIARATATVLHAAGLNFAVLGNDEACSGDVARRAGNEYLFFEMAQTNIKTLTRVGANQKTIVANCPHCLHTLGKEYAGYGGSYTVLHHSQLIADLVGSGKLRLDGQQLRQVTFHDPCYLGRHNDVLDAPRDALAQAGATLLEMGRSRKDSFCCGAGGGQMWKEEEPGSEAVNRHRFAEAQATGAQTLAVGCPFCARMLNDANTAAGSPLAVKDVAQIVSEAVRR